MGRVSDARERLVEAATHLIHAAGYGAVGVQQICDRARVRPGSFYHFFPSKRDLLLAVIEQFRQRHRGRRTLVQHLPPLKRIEALLRVTADHHAAIAEATGKAEGSIIANLSLELSAKDEVVRESLVKNFDEWLEFFESSLREGIAAGDLAPIDARRGAEVLLAHLQGALVVAKTYNSPMMFERLCAQAVQLVRQLPPTDQSESVQPWSA